MGDIFGSPILTNILLIIIIYGVWELLGNLKLINKEVYNFIIRELPRQNSLYDGQPKPVKGD